jgi:phospholipase/carboxylesterase
MMRMLTRALPYVLCLLVVISIIALAETPKNDKSKAKMDSVQPVSTIYDESAGDFLDTNLDDLQKAAFDAYNKSEYEKAAEGYLAYLKYDIRDSASIYNLACCYGLLGNDKLAADYLARAVRAGFTDFGHIKVDPDFDKVRDKDSFKEVLKDIDTMLADEKKETGDVVLVESPSLLKCRVHLPENYDPKKSYPLVVGLHGFGSNPEQFIRIWRKFGLVDFILATPQGPYPVAQGSEIGYSWLTNDAESEKTAQKSMEISEDYVKNVVINLHKKYKVSDTYLLGFSQGAGLSYQAGIRNYELFKGIICFGGNLNTKWLGEEAFEKAKGLKVFIAHGTNDRVIGIDNAIKANDYLKSHGFDVTFYKFEGGHQVPEDATREVELWMQKD